MKYKILFLISSIFLLSGCTLNYELTIDKDGFVEEKATVVESNDILYTYDLDVSSFIEELYDGIESKEQYDSYMLSTDQDGSYSYGIGLRDYLDLDNYKNKSTIVSDMFSEVIISDSDGIVSITMNPNDSFEYFYEDSLSAAIIDEVNIKISVPYTVTNSNADRVEDNTYIWNIQKGEDLKEIYISYDTNQVIKEEISTNTWIIIGIAGVIIIAGVYVFIKYKRNGA